MLEPQLVRSNTANIRAKRRVRTSLKYWELATTVEHKLIPLGHYYSSTKPPSPFRMWWIKKQQCKKLTTVDLRGKKCIQVGDRIRKQTRSFSGHFQLHLSHMSPSYLSKGNWEYNSQSTSTPWHTIWPSVTDKTVRNNSCLPTGLHALWLQSSVSSQSSQQEVQLTTRWKSSC